MENVVEAAPCGKCRSDKVRTSDHSLKISLWQKGISRRGFLKGTLAGICLSFLHLFHRVPKGAALPSNPLFWVKNIPNQPFREGGNGNHHAGIESLLRLMGDQGLKFYRTSEESSLSGPSGMIASNDVVLIKVNAQWKYRGCTNSDLVRGLIQRILDHPDGFSGEVVIFENGQGRGKLNCDSVFQGENYPDASIHANANDENQSFLYLVNTVFDDSRVSAVLLDPIRGTFIEETNHITNGYRIYENVSYPCFTTAGGRRVELREGIWNGSDYTQNLKLINFPVLKIHDVGGSEITAALKHFYGIVSMSDGQSPFRHYSGLGETGGKMVVSVRTPVLNLIDAIWVPFSTLSGYPADTTFRANQLLASQDPVALDYWAAKYIIYPISKSSRHLPTFSGIDAWLTSARDIINDRGGIYDINSGILVGSVTKDEAGMSTLLDRFHLQRVDFDGDSKADLSLYRSGTGGWQICPSRSGSVYQVGFGGDPSDIPVPGDYDGDGKTDIAVYRSNTGAWFVYPSSESSIYGVGFGGDASDKPVPGDYDGDGKTDIAIYRASTGAWFIYPSGGGSAYGVGFGGDPSDIPVPGDYDGDGKTDIAIYRRSTGAWFIQPSEGGPIRSVGFGGDPSDIPVPGDYDGDGKTDIAVYRSNTGAWFIYPSSGSPIYGVGFGGDASDKPVPGDYDGDGKTDIAVYRASTGAWFIYPSGGGSIYGVGFGGDASDFPLTTILTSMA